MENSGNLVNCSIETVGLPCANCINFSLTALASSFDRICVSLIEAVRIDFNSASVSSGWVATRRGVGGSITSSMALPALPLLATLFLPLLALVFFSLVCLPPIKQNPMGRCQCGSCNPLERSTRGFNFLKKFLVEKFLKNSLEITGTSCVIIHNTGNILYNHK